MSADLGALIPELQAPANALVDLAGRAGVQPRVTSTLRSHSQQQRLYDAFLRGETQYPVAPPGLSSHEYGYAFDMIAATRVDLHDLGKVWRRWGGVWSPKDEVHFEYPGFVPGQSVAPAGGCSGLASFLLKFADIAVGFLKYAGEAQLVAWLLSYGFPHSEILKFVNNPAEYLAGCS